MKKVTFITGNQKKADYLARYLGHHVEHIKIDLDEIQSLDLRVVVRHKLLQAYAQVQGPVLVEDVSFEFHALGRLPGTFSRWFIDEIGLDGLCTLITTPDRSATARCIFGYFDGEEECYFEGSLEGTIAQIPVGEGGYGFDKIFIPKGYTITRAQMSEEDDKKTYIQMKPFQKIKEFLTRNSKVVS